MYADLFLFLFVSNFTDKYLNKIRRDHLVNLSFVYIPFSWRNSFINPIWGWGQIGLINEIQWVCNIMFIQNSYIHLLDGWPLKFKARYPDVEVRKIATRTTRSQCRSILKHYNEIPECTSDTANCILFSLIIVYILLQRG